MQYSVVAILALAASATASYNQTVVYTTEVVDVYETVCPASATITYQGVTYTNTLTESSTITISNCPCTVSKPVYTTSSVYCNTCVAPTSAPVYPTIYPNSTVPTTEVPEVPGTTYIPSSSPSASTVPVSGGNKIGAGFAGLLCLAAFLL